MRKLMFLVTLAVIAALAWGGYWYVGASAMERALGGWLDERRAGGWVAEAAALDTRGFPNRFDTTFEALELADPDTEVGWSMPVFQLLQLSYKPNHVIAVWPDVQRVALPGQEIEVTSRGMLGSVEVAPDPALPLRALTIEAEAARFVSSRGWTSAFAGGQLSMRQSPDPIGPNSYDVYFDATDLEPSAETLARLGAAVDLPETIAHLRLTGSVGFDKRWDKSAIEDARPQPRLIRLDEAVARWGDLGIEARGEFEVGPDGAPTGALDLKATNWRAIVAVMEASGRIDPDYVGALTRGLELLAALNGDPDTLDVPLGFKNGWMSIGPVPVMPAPTIALP